MEFLPLGRTICQQNYDCKKPFHINIYLYIKTTIDMPDALMQRVKTVAAQRKTTFRALVVDALERSLDQPSAAFQLEDAAVGPPPEAGDPVDNETINRAIDAQRDPPLIP